MQAYIYPAIATLVLVFLAVLVNKKKDLNLTARLLAFAGLIGVAGAVVIVSGVMLWIDYSGWSIIQAV